MDEVTNVDNGFIDVENYNANRGRFLFAFSRKYQVGELVREKSSLCAIDEGLVPILHKLTKGGSGGKRK